MSKLNRYQLPRLNGRQVQLFIADTCDLKCDGCPYPQQSPEIKKAIKDKELNLTRWYKIIDYFYNNNIRLFCIIGGEPVSYIGIEQIIANITKYPDTFVLLSTSGIHLLHNNKLRKAVGNVLTQTVNRQFKNSVVVSYDVLTSGEKLSVKNSRALKAQQGFDFIRVMKQEYKDKITYIANVMVTPFNLDSIPEMQEFLEKEGIYTNLCTQQGKCFGAKKSIFNKKHIKMLKKVGVEMIKRKINKRLVVNSVAYLSQLSGIIGMEKYHCWEEPYGNPVIDVGSDGTLRFCNWIGQNQKKGVPGISLKQLIDKKMSWAEYWRLSKRTTQKLCTGCSWSRRDRTENMVSFNPDIFTNSELPNINPQDTRLQNIWVEAQRSIMSW